MAEKRSQMIGDIRAWFSAQDFMEVDTPALQISPGLEPHLQAFKTLRVIPGEGEQTLYLHTSPEFAMKKLLVAGMERIYQMNHVFRNNEKGSTHSCEFTMLEWYRAHADYEDIMRDTIDLVRACAPDTLRFKGRESDPHKDWQKISVAEAFQTYADMDVTTITDDDLFFDIFLEKIEPNLGHPVPTILYDYPAHMAALSKVKESDTRWAERFEIYICGLELANAFTELTDADEQLKRFEADMDLKESLYGERYPIDMDFIAALRAGMPPAGGIALGVDRLAMLVCGTDDINDVLWASV